MPAGKKPSQDVILYRAHFYSPIIAGEIQRLQHELPDIALHVVGMVRDGAQPQLEEIAPSMMLTRADIEALPYPAKVGGINWQANVHRGGPPDDLPVLAFFRRFPNYRHYWIVEYDVRYSGHWRSFMNDMDGSDADLLCTTVFDYDEYPDFYFWQTIRQQTDTLYESSLVRGFFPFARLSNAALKSIVDRYERGWTGHYEVLWPTICKLDGLKVEDIGNIGRYTPPHRVGKHYSCTPHTRTQFPGTFIWRPSFSSEDIPALAREAVNAPMLWHPVKERP